MRKEFIVAKVARADSHYSVYTSENNVTLVQSFVNNELKDMIERVCKRDDVKLGAFVEWACAVGVNESKLIGDMGVVETFDMTQLHGVTKSRKAASQTIKSLKEQLADMQAQIAALTAEKAAA